MTTRDQPRPGWTIALRRSLPAVQGRPEGGYADAYDLMGAATAVTIPTWITPRSHPSFSGFAGHARSRPVSRHTKSIAGCTSSLPAPPACGR